MLALPEIKAPTLVPEGCQIAAGNDREAIASWLKEAPQSQYPKSLS